ncbi:hypothetical protein I0C86_10060 [Plantactinospora sp. S1510]|uniref:Uncharacterized protein n=1 Tax=Plantactinospora alkalitolerans TaxID=2789879 RepID=A0ABS0GTT5_9ACTN|nr:hypothetical protein [Plantactinospora alkalitolerans]MBF9129312.1 hypothetical protein [Plantactinospora alkalitolerans]
MAPLAATATPALPHDAAAAALLLLALLAVTLGYLATCWIFPFVACRRCHGTGKCRAPFGRAFRLCSRCDGDGYPLRPGRLVLNYLRNLHDKGTR